MKKSAYQTRIEKKLASLSIALTPASILQFKSKTRKGPLSETIFGADEWKSGKTNGPAGKPVRAYYSGVGKVCELCGHNPIKRVFVIEARKNNKQLHIGSECATNYLDADVIAGISKIFNLEYNKLVNPIKYEKEIEVLEWAAKYSIRVPGQFQLINSGHIGSVLQKIATGRGITKREKEVFAAYSKAWENKEINQALANWYAQIRVQIQYKWQTEHEARLERNRKAATDRARRYCGERFIQILREIKKIAEAGDTDPNYLITRINAADAKLAYKENKHLQIVTGLLNRNHTIQDWQIKRLQDIVEIAENGGNFVETIVSDSDEENIQQLLDYLFAQKLGRSFKFVNSVSSYFRRENKLSEKQFLALAKIAGG